MTTANPGPERWANPGLDLLVELGGVGGLRARLEHGLREAIRSGRLPRGARLPPTRGLAADLGISRGTVLAAYDQLVGEGWLTGRRGSGTVVALGGGTHADAVPDAAPQARRWRFDLLPGRPDPSSFPRTDWLRALRAALAVAPHDAFGYGDARGQLAVREELAGYLRRARGLRVGAADLLMTTGFTQGLTVLARALAATGVRRVAMEEPSMSLHRAIVRRAGHELVLLRVDEAGARIDDLAAADVGAVVLTPNRQHPSGATLGAVRRTRLLEWARATNAVVVEDDYDGEFRYDRRPIGPLQGLAPDVVAYAGTASKTLAPGVRLGWLALPGSLRAAVAQEQEHSAGPAGALDQLAFAELLRTNAYDRHIRRMRLRYRRRRDTLVSELTAADPRLRVTGGAAGLNVVVPVPDAAVEAAALAAARAAGIGLDGLAVGGYYENGGPAGVIVGYAAPPQNSFGHAVGALVGALRSLPVRHRDAVGMVDPAADACR